MTGIGETIRLSRLFANGENAVVIAVDHGLYFGPISGLTNLPLSIECLWGADGILLSAGMVSHCQGFFARRGAPTMILRLNWATNYVAPWNYDHSHAVRLLHVTEAMRLGADVVVASLTLKAPDQAEDAHNVELFAGFVQEKFLAGTPLLCEVYPIAGDTTPPEELQEQISLGCRMAAELGADLVKTFYTGKDFEKITSATPIPILALGSVKKPRERDVVSMAAEAVARGAKGVVFGRNVVQARQPERFLEALKEVVKMGAAPDTVTIKYQLD